VIRFVPQAHAAIVERFGRYYRTLGAGLSLTVPFIDRLRLVDLREQVISISAAAVKTRDDATASVDVVVYAQVVDPRAATYEVSDYRVGIEQLVITTLRNQASDLTLADLVYGRQDLSVSLRAVVDDAASRWGVRINRLDIQNVGGPGGPDTTDLLDMLATLRAAGILTSEEFQAKRGQVLSPLTTEAPDPDRM
jgi:regulator of protease activity HflC (stomatin/prohibitin superfamily)